jgi:hypothetical protein
MTFLFRIVWGIDVIIALVALLFFVWGINDGSVSSFTMALWVGILAALGIIVFGSRALHLSERRVLATLLAAVPAVPALLYGLLIVAMTVGGTRWI